MSNAELLRPPANVRQAWARRACAATGFAFVVLTFAGNSLTESVINPSAELSGQQALENFAITASSTVAQVGLMMELLGFVALTVFVGFIVDTVRRRGVHSMAGVVAAVSATITLAVKLGSGASYLAGLTYHSALTPDTALALTLINDAAFVISWLPFAVFVLAAALALHTAGAIGRFGAGAGLVIGALGIPATLAGVTDTASALPVPFLLGCLWTAAVSVKAAFASESSLHQCTSTPARTSTPS